jgi:hypothetical protein
MTKAQKRLLLLLVVLGLAYFAVFIVPNSTGAKDATMLSAFEHDEFAQYPNVIHMLVGGTTIKQAVHNFLVYNHYYYGYPFYFFSAIAILPLKWILGAGWTSQTQTIVAVLRQTINVLPMILAAFLLVLDQLKSKSPWKALLSFLLLLSLPAVIGNNLWWHPDSLLTLFSVLTILFLVKDDGKFGLYFYLSGIVCALAIGAKILGVLFVLTYASYLVYGLVAKKSSWKKTILSALLFLVVLVASVIVTNPLLVFPIEHKEVIAVFKTNLAESSQGFWLVGNGITNKLGEILGTLNQYYGGLLLFFTALLTAIIGCFTKGKRLKYLIILTWVIGFMGYFVFFAFTLRPHYFIPAVLPLYITLLDVIPDSWTNFKQKLDRKHRKEWLKRIGSALIILLMAVVLVINSVQAVGTIKDITNREAASGSLAMFKTFQDQFLPDMPQGTPLVIYRDWRAYVADNPHWQVIYNWNLADYDYLNGIKPDILFIERDNVFYFSDPAKIAEAIDPAEMRRMNQFYSDVLNNRVTGFHQIYKDDFGYILVSDALFLKYFR